MDNFLLQFTRINKSSLKKVLIKTDEEVINEIIEKGLSLSRFGDGELKWILKIPQNSFETETDELSSRLIEVLTNEEAMLLVAIPNVFNNLNHFRFSARRFWRIYMNEHRKEWLYFINLSRIYGNSLITRPYMDYPKNIDVSYKFSAIKKIWQNRDIVTVEGSKTFLGVGNNLFSNANSLKRVIVPATNAFSRYGEILSYITLNIDSNHLMLLALGPTATILAYDLCKLGYQAIDIGHIDIEYEWFLSKAKTKKIIIGKYVNENNRKWISSKELIMSNNYLNSIITIIGE